MIIQRTGFVSGLALLTLGGCQTTPIADSGFLSGYDQMEARKNSLRAAVRERRDEAAAKQIERVFVEPAAAVGDAGAALAEGDRIAVLRELDRQVCYELSERFTVVSTPHHEVARVRIGVARIAPTGQAASAASAVAAYFIPGPLDVRVPGTTGGLAAEAELLAPGSGDQVAAIVWAREATVVGTDAPSLSEVGDALQLAEPFGDAVGDAFAPSGRKPRPIAKPDPCAEFGPRFSPAEMAASLATGLYVPELSGATKRRSATPR